MKIISVYSLEKYLEIMYHLENELVNQISGPLVYTPKK